MLSTDVCYNGTLSSDDFGVILGVHSDGQFITPECLWGKGCKHRLDSQRA